MTYHTESELINKLLNSKYQQISELLNSTNKNLFIGPNNLLVQDSIESAKIFTKSIDEWEVISDIIETEDTIHVLKGNLGSQPISNHMVAIFRLGRNLTSHTHIVHGGAIASLIDEYFVKVALPLTPNNFAVTASLNIKYLRPVKFREDERTINVVLECYVSKSVDNRKFTVKGWLKDLEGNQFCTGEILVVVPKGPL